MKKKKQLLPTENPLKKQVRPFDETMSAFYPLKKYFFPHLFDADGKEKALTEAKN